jgi:hypothetical protein
MLLEGIGTSLSEAKVGFLRDLIDHIFGPETPNAGSAEASMAKAEEAGSRGDYLEQRDHENDAFQHMDNESEKDRSTSDPSSGGEPGGIHERGDHGSEGSRDSGGSEHGSGGSHDSSSGGHHGSGSGVG